jgi:hypothetical protein
MGLFVGFEQVSLAMLRKLNWLTAGKGGLAG